MATVFVTSAGNARTATNQGKLIDQRDANPRLEGKALARKLELEDHWLKALISPRILFSWNFR